MARGRPASLTEYRRKRDFSRTGEPAGHSAAHPPRRTKLRFVIQKHAASHLHFDLRLELDGVMKSWAVPKGPSLDPTVKRLAMEVEDHPIEYNTFEGTIPAGEYGGGTVMLWDHGTYRPATDSDEDDATLLRQGYERGDLKIVLEGERLRGSWVLVRMRGRGSRASKPQWLLIKHRDDEAREGADVVADTMTSVTTGRTMEEIAVGKRKVWKSNRASVSNRTSQGRARSVSARPTHTKTSSSMPKALEPMYATIGHDIPGGEGWTFEPKYDGIRVLAHVADDAVRLITRNGNDKTKQFPEIADALRALSRKAGQPFVADGEIIAIVDGEIARFQALQERMHVKSENTIASLAKDQPAAIVLFDLLAHNEDTLLSSPWIDRRKRLDQLLRRRTNQRIRLAPSVPGDGEEMLARAQRDGWEGVIAKRTDATYDPGIRSRNWLKLKVEHRQEFVVGGWTDPRNSREHIGALLLGYFDGDRFVYVGHTGGGFTREGLRTMHRRLLKLERKTPPFERPPRTNERAHWTRPEIVVEVKFNEWTSDGKLRQPIFLGVRDDKDARDVGREPESVQPRSSGRMRARRTPAGAAAKRTARRKADAKSTTPAAPASKSTRKKPTAGKPASTAADSSIVRQLEEIERSGPDGVVALGGNAALSVTSLDKVFFPDDGYTKGDLMRYYARVAGVILPAIADRPLVLKRYPNGIKGQWFYQQNAAPNVPKGVRVETIRSDQGERQRRYVGGDLTTLLYTVQLGAISVDPWHARVPELSAADYTILDLDPGAGATFRDVVEVALLVHDIIGEYGLTSVAKTSGSSGIHIVIPLEARLSDETAMLAAQIIATRVAERAPSLATVERSVKARPKGTVYVDYLQNIRGKTVAGVYSVRARPGATVSTPLEWKEVDPKLDPGEFTIETVPHRLERVGDIWARAMTQPNPVRALVETLPGKPKARR